MTLTLLVAPGCGGNACEDAVDRVAAKFDECGVDYEETEADGECTDEAGEQLECIADCTESATCGALDGSDSAASGDYFSCVGGCV